MFINNNNFNQITNLFTDGHALRIYGTTEKTKRFEPTLFYNTCGVIWCYNKEILICERNDITIKDLEKHVKNMISQGFTIELI